MTKFVLVRVVDPVAFDVVSVTVYEPVCPYVTTTEFPVLPVGEAVAPKFQAKPVGANCHGVTGVVDTKATVPPATMEIPPVAPVAVAKFVYGAAGIGPWLVVIPSGVLSKSG